EVLWEVALNAIFLAPAEGWIGKNDIHAVARGIADVRPREGVVMTDETRILNTVEQHVGYTEHVGQLLFLDRPQPFLHTLLVLYFFHVPVAHVAKRAGEESARAA